MSVDRLDRETYILDRLARDGALSVAGLSADLGVSEVTIRSTLRTLENQGLLSRTRGGATAGLYRSVLERQRDQASAKDRIAAAAAALVEDGDTVMIEAGTTTAAVIAHLGHRRVQVVTNSTLVFTAARQHMNLDVILTGGSVHRPSESLVGPLAVECIQRFNVRLAFVGTDGFTIGRGITTSFPEGAEVVRAMAGRAEATWLLADATKYGRAGFVGVLPLIDLTGIIADTDLAAPSREALTDITDVRIV